MGVCFTIEGALYTIGILIFLMFLLTVSIIFNKEDKEMKKNSNRSHHKKIENLDYFAAVSGRNAKIKKYAKENKEDKK